MNFKKDTHAPIPDYVSENRAWRIYKHGVPGGLWYVQRWNQGIDHVYSALSYREAKDWIERQAA